MIKIEKVLEETTNWAILGAVLLLPVFFLPITSERLEWNKHYLLGILIVVALLAWLGQGLVSKKLMIRRSPVDLFLTVFWLILLIAGILSQDRITSFLGLDKNVSGGFLAFTFYLLFAFFLIWSVKREISGPGLTIGKVLLFLGIGSGLTMIYFWLGRFGLWEKLSYLPKRQPVVDLESYYGVFLVIILVLALGLLISVKSGGGLFRRSDKSRSLTMVWTVVAALSLITLVALGFKIIWIAALVGSFFLLLFSFSRLEEVRYPLVSLAMVIFVTSLVFLILGTPKFLTLTSPIEVTLSHKSSWQITANTLKEGPRKFIFGNGPETFIYGFSAHRPESYNRQPFWDIRFSRPVASSYQLLFGTGVLGLIAFLALILVMIGLVRQGWLKAKDQGGREEARGIFFALAATWLTLFVMFFLTNFNTVLWFYFFTLLGLLVVVGEVADVLPARHWTLSLKATPQYALATSFIYIVVVAAVVIGGVFLGRFYNSDVLAMRAARAAARRDFDGAEKRFERALALNPYRVSFYLTAAETLLHHAAIESRREKPDGQLIGQLVGRAINVSLIATRRAPDSVSAWEQLARLYNEARPFSKEATGWVITSLNQALKIEITNPRLYLLRSQAYRADKKETEAEADIRRAVELKSDYAPAQYALSILLEEKKDFDGAAAAAEIAARVARRDLDAQFNLGRILYNRQSEGDADRAEQIFRRILTINKDYANALYSLALLLERQDKNEEAASFYRRILELNPNNQEVKDRLTKLGEAVPEKVEPNPPSLREEAPAETE